MKKVVLALVLGIATSTVCAVPVAFAQDQITIKDPAEYNAYSNAIGTSAPAAKAAALEDFLTKYPQTVVKLQVLNTLLTTYQQANDQPNMLKTAKRVLDADPNNLRAAFVYVYLTKTQATAKAATDPAGAQPMFDDAATVAQAALKVTAPSPGSGVSADDFTKLKTATTPIFESAIATDDVGKKDYKDAIDNYTAELKSYPDLSAAAGAPGINETYMLGQAYLQEDPKDLPNGIFYLTRAAQYAPPAAKDGVEKAAEYWYQKYHGGMDGFDAIKQLAHDNATPPDSYKPTPAPPPPAPDKLAHDAVTAASTPELLKAMALSDKEFVLANGTQEDADKVWGVMKGVQAKEIPGIVVAATPTSVQLAVSPDNQQATPKVADFTINFTKPLTTPPAVGSTVKYDGTFDSYTKTPLMINLVDGAVSGEKKPAAKAPVHRKPAAH